MVDPTFAAIIGFALGASSMFVGFAIGHASATRLYFMGAGRLQPGSQFDLLAGGTNDLLCEQDDD